jgi:hypothetical protein
MNRLTSWAQKLHLNTEGVDEAVNFVKRVAMMNIAGDIDEESTSNLVQITDNIYGSCLI